MRRSMKRSSWTPCRRKRCLCRRSLCRLLIGWVFPSRSSKWTQCITARISARVCNLCRCSSRQRLPWMMTRFHHFQSKRPLRPLSCNRRFRWRAWTRCSKKAWVKSQQLRKAKWWWWWKWWCNRPRRATNYMNSRALRKTSLITQYPSLTFRATPNSWLSSNRICKRWWWRLNRHKEWEVVWECHSDYI